MDFASQRAKMVQDQLMKRGIRDPKVLRCLKTVPREEFVDDKLLELAYHDRALQIDCDQTISQPYIVALSTEALALEPTDRVLEIGTGSGYQTAILAELAGLVVSIERHAELSCTAQARLERLGYKNVKLLVGDGSIGVDGIAQPVLFDKILVTATASQIPPALLDQLKIGGRMVIPVGPENQQELQLVEKRSDGCNVTPLCKCVFVKLIGRQGWEP